MTNNILTILIGVSGAIINRVRGGGLTDLAWDANWVREGEEKGIKSFSKNLHDFIFAIIFTSLCHNSISLNSFYFFIAMFLAVRAGRSFGWGAYLNGMIEKKVRFENEVYIIDKLVLQNANHAVLRNTTAMSLRGLIWSSILSFTLLICSLVIESSPIIRPIGYLLINISGLLMGPCYLLAMFICEKIIRIGRGHGWALGEAFFGFNHWFLFSYVLLNYSC